MDLIARDGAAITKADLVAETRMSRARVDEIFPEESELFDAIVDSGVSRLRPVAMAALTTALGMIPLLFDAFFVSMAITIIGGLLFASVLTMIIVPVFYAILFRAPAE